MLQFIVCSEKPLSFPKEFKVLHFLSLYDAYKDDCKAMQFFKENNWSLQSLKDTMQYHVECKDEQKLIDFCEQTPGIYDYWEM